MTTYNSKPRENDAVLGGFTPDIYTSAVLGGLQDAIERFNSNDEATQILALKQATQYG